MASLGLAWYQGQKNAQDAARGQIATMLDMAKNAAETDRQNEYFSSTQKALRERGVQNANEKLKALQEIDQLKKDIKTDPAGAAAKMISEKYGQPYEVKRLQDGRFVAQPKLAQTDTTGMSPAEKAQAQQMDYARAKTAMAHTLDLGTSPMQMLGSLLQEKISSTEDLFADITGKSNAEIAKRLEIEKENAKALGQEQAKSIWHYPNELDKARIQAGATLGAANIAGQAGIRQEQVKHELSAKDVYEHLLYPALQTKTGAYKDKVTGKMMVLQKTPDGKSTEVELSQADPQTQQLVYGELGRMEKALPESLKAGKGYFGVYEVPSLKDEFANNLVRQENVARIGLNGPTASSPDRAQVTGTGMVRPAGLPTSADMYDPEVQKLVQGGVNPETALKMIVGQRTPRPVYSDEVQMGYE